ncbi:hypothetical protein P692DRAFT_20199642 [Suillus brevipes Sb2]|nr:hypothetical protein P692DRAFT_20199642 [Suillus brevipes Sb2]
MNTSLPDPRNAFKAFILALLCWKQDLGDMKNEAAFLVRHAADYSQTPLEPIKGDWNAQTLARSEMWMHKQPVCDEHSWPSSWLKKKIGLKSAL